MLPKVLISNVIPCLKTSDLGIEALNIMNNFKVSHLPVVSNGIYLGLISDADICKLNLEKKQIGNNLSLSKPHVINNQHVYDVLSLASKAKLTTIPVLNEDKKYEGLITISGLVNAMVAITGADNPGSIIILEQKIHEYSMAEISQIVESNNAKILSSYINASSYSTLIEVVLKINTIDLTSIIQTFLRYNYSIKEKFTTDDKTEEINQERFEEFLHYLNV